MIATIIRKELHMLFISPLAWLLLALIQAATASVFLVRLDAFLEIQPRMWECKTVSWTGFSGRGLDSSLDLRIEETDL